MKYPTICKVTNSEFNNYCNDRALDEICFYHYLKNKALITPSKSDLSFMLNHNIVCERSHATIKDIITRLV